MYYVIFDNSTGKITGFTNVTPEDDNYIEVSEEAYIRFVEDSTERNNYIVKYNVSTKSYVLLPYQQPKVNYDIKDIIHHVPYTQDAECIITKHNGKWTVQVANSNVLLAPNQICKFSVTRRRDIHMLIRTFDATIEQLTNNFEVTFSSAEEKEDVTIYTPMVFKSYGIIDATV